MLPLHETETRLAKGILGGADADDLIVADWLKPSQRMAIYRYHYKATLREVLGLSFPVIARLVGEGFFNGMADTFTSTNPPARPCLAEYGGGFPDFIAGFESAKSLPYLADVALLEWLLLEAAHTPGYEGNGFYSRYPVGRIWETNQPEYRGDGKISLDEGGGWFVVEKTEGVTRWKCLDLPPDAFAQPEGNPAQ